MPSPPPPLLFGLTSNITSIVIIVACIIITITIIITSPSFQAGSFSGGIIRITPICVASGVCTQVSGARARLIVTEPDAQQLSNTLWALGRLSFSGQLTIEAAAHQVQSAQHFFGPQETSNRTRTPTSSVFLNLAALEGLADQAIRMATHFDPQGLAMVAWSFATCELRDLPLFDIASERVLSIVHELDPQFPAISA